MKNTNLKEVLIFKDLKGNEPLMIWLKKLDKEIQRRIKTRLLRLNFGNYGDFKRINKDILELKFTFGSGYRIYFAEEKDTIILLLCAGDKKTQSNDIDKAIEYYQKYREYKNE